MARVRYYALIWLAGLPAFALVRLFGHPFMARAWANTLLLALATIATALPIGFGLAWLLFRVRPYGARLAVALLAAWMLMPLYLQAGAWQAVLDRFFTDGAVGSWRRGLPSAIWGVWWVHVASAVPWCSAAMAWALRLLPKSWEDQAALDVQPRRAWWLVSWPYWLAASSMAATWVLLTVTVDMTASDLFQVETVAEVVYLRYALGLHTEVQPLAWESLLMLAWIATLLGTGVCMLLSPIAEAVERHARGSPNSRRPLLAAAVTWLCLAVFLGVPIGVLAYQAGVRSIEVAESPGTWERHWSALKLVGITCGLGPYADAFVATQFAREWCWSLIITGASALTATAMGSWLAFAAYRSRLWAAAALFIIAGLWSIPGPQWGLWQATAWTATDGAWVAYLYDQTPIPPILAGALRSFPAAIIIWWGGFRTLSPRLSDTLRLEGWGFWRQWLLVAVPARRRLIWASTLVSGALVFGDIGSTMPVIPPGMLTITIRVFDLLHAGVDDLVAGICLLLIFVGTALVVIVSSRLRPLW